MLHHLFQGVEYPCVTSNVMHLVISCFRYTSRYVLNPLFVHNHFLSTSFGISSIQYRGHLDLLRGSGQGNVLSSNICHDQSCFIFRDMEHDEMGVIIVTPITQQIIVQTALGFVDDSVFFQ